MFNFNIRRHNLLITQSPTSTEVEESCFYIGHRVIVRPMRANDLFSLYQRPDVAGILSQYRPWQVPGMDDITTIAARMAWLSEFEPPPEIEALVLHRTSLTPLGFLCLSAIDHVNAKAEFAAAFFRGRGSRPALEALHWGINAAFTRFSLYKLIFHVLPGNMQVRTLFENLDIKEEALLKEEIRLPDGNRVDLLRYSLFRHAWEDSDLSFRCERLAPVAVGTDQS